MIPIRADLKLGAPGKDSKYQIGATLSNKGGVVTHLELTRFEKERVGGNRPKDPPRLVLLQDHPSYKLWLKDEPELATKTWEYVEKESEPPKRVVFRTTALEGKLQIDKRFSLTEDDYHINLRSSSRTRPTSRSAHCLSCKQKQPG